MSNTKDWVNWDAAMRLLAKGGVSVPWHSLRYWAWRGLVDSKPGTMIGDGGAIHSDEVLPKEVWQGRPNPKTGALLFSNPDPIDGTQPDMVLHILAPQFRRDQLVALMAHLPPEQASEALQPVGSAIALKAMEAGATQNRGGAKRSIKWDDFMAELVFYLAMEGCPAGQDTEGAEELISTVLTRLTERGNDEPLSRSSAQSVVNAVLRRFRSELKIAS